MSRHDHKLLEDEHVTIDEVQEHESSPSRPATKHIGKIGVDEPADYVRRLIPKAVDYGCAMTDRSFCVLVDVEGLALIIVTDGALTLELAPSKDALKRLIQDTHTACVGFGWVDRRVSEQPAFIRKAIPHTPSWMVERIKI